MIPPGSLIIDFAVPHVSEVWPRPRGILDRGGPDLGSPRFRGPWDVDGEPDVWSSVWTWVHHNVYIYIYYIY